MLGDLTGVGISFFGMDESRGYVKTAAEISPDRLAPKRSIRRHWANLEG